MLPLCCSASRTYAIFCTLESRVFSRCRCSYVLYVGWAISTTDNTAFKKPLCLFNYESNALLRSNWDKLPMRCMRGGMCGTSHERLVSFLLPRADGSLLARCLGVLHAQGHRQGDEGRIAGGSFDVVVCDIKRVIGARSQNVISHYGIVSLARMFCTAASSSIREIAKLFLPASLSDAPTK